MNSLRKQKYIWARIALQQTSGNQEGDICDPFVEKLVERLQKENGAKPGIKVVPDPTIDGDIMGIGGDGKMALDRVICSEVVL